MPKCLNLKRDIKKQQIANPFSKQIASFHFSVLFHHNQSRDNFIISPCWELQSKYRNQIHMILFITSYLLSVCPLVFDFVMPYLINAMLFSSCHKFQKSVQKLHYNAISVSGYIIWIMTADERTWHLHLTSTCFLFVWMLSVLQFACSILLLFRFAVDDHPFSK